MAGSLNQVSLIGNLGRDPEIKSTKSGDKVANFSIATSEAWGKGDDRVEKTEWHNIVVWGKLADVVERYCTKGTKLFVQGKLTTRKWQDKDGKDRYTTEVVVSGFGGQLTMLSGKGESGGGRSTSRHEAAHASGPALPDDEIPF